MKVVIIKSLSISDYASISTCDAVFIIGGLSNRVVPLTTIARYQNDGWEHIGDLIIARSGFGAIKYGPQYYIIGGNAFTYGPNNMIISDR